MKTFWHRLSLVFAAGALGGLANALAVGLYQSWAAAEVIGFRLSAEMLYQRVVWGGIWGALFLLRLKARSVWLRGLILSLIPSLVQLLIVFPARGEGLFGVHDGPFMFVQVLIFNAIWGVVASWWLKHTYREA